MPADVEISHGPVRSRSGDARRESGAQAMRARIQRGVAGCAARGARLPGALHARRQPRRARRGHARASR